MADQAEEFWSAFEKETGEKVEVRAIGEFYRTGGNAYGLWGLLVLTDKSFRFRHIPSENWLSSLFRRADKSSAPKESVEISIPRSEIVSIKAPKHGFIARLFGPAFPRFTITSRNIDGEKPYLFSVDPSGGFLTSLENAVLAGKTSENTLVGAETP